MKKNVLSILTVLLSLTTVKSQNFAWAKSIGDVNNDMGYAIATDPSGNVIAAGNFSGTIDCNTAAPGTQTLISPAGGAGMFLTKFNSAGSLLWARSFDGSSNQNAINAITTDASGNIYTVGRYSGVVDLDPSPSAIYTVTAGAGSGAGIFVSKLDASGNFVWAFGIKGTSGANYGNGITTDAAGNVYLVGSFSSTLDFDPAPTTKTLAALNGSDVFVGKYTSAGNLVWVGQIGGGGGTWGKAIAVDASQNVYTTGWFNGIADMNPAPAAVSNFTSMGAQDMFVSKLDASGNFVWARQIGGPLMESPYAIAVDNSSNIYLTGNFAGTTDFDPSAATYTLTSFGSTGSSIFLCKLDASGLFTWANAFGSSNGNNDGVLGLVLSSQGNIFITGGFYDTVDFDPSPAGTYTVKTAGGIDTYVAKYSSNGAFGWVAQMSSNSYDLGQAIAVDANENVYTTGGFYATADYDPSPTSSYTLTSAGLYDIFISKLTPEQGPTVGISSYDKAAGLSVFPNPASEKITLRKNTEETLTAVIYNVAGQQVLSTMMQDSATEMNIQSLSTGFYQVVILNGNTAVYQTKLIKK